MNKTPIALTIGVFLFSVPLSNGGGWLSHRKNDVRPTTPANTAIRSPSNREPTELGLRRLPGGTALVGAYAKRIG